MQRRKFIRNSLVFGLSSGLLFSTKLYGNQLFFPDLNWKPSLFSKDKPLKIVNIGPCELPFKGVATTLKYLRYLLMYIEKL
jgi:hypothetical protein